MLRRGLIVPQYLAKAVAVPSAILAAGSQGNFLEKVGSGFYKLISFPVDVCNSVSRLSAMNYDSNTMTAREFAKKYGREMAEGAVNYGHNALDYIDQFALNFSEQPVTTLAASAVALGIPLVISRGLRFWRQHGQGSLLDRIERNAGNNIWKGE